MGVLGLPKTRQEARELGEKRFYTGVPCKHGHVTLRRTDSGACTDCLLAVNRNSSPTLALNRNLRPLGPTETLPRNRADARVLGVDSYMTGKVCKNGHVDERYTLNGSCKSCINSATMEPRRLPVGSVWVPHYGRPISLPDAAVTYSENRRMNARLPLYAQAILADVRDGEPQTTPAEIAEAILLGRLLRQACISLVRVAEQIPVLAALCAEEAS